MHYERRYCSPKSNF